MMHSSVIEGTPKIYLNGARVYLIILAKLNLNE